MDRDDEPALSATADIAAARGMFVASLRSGDIERAAAEYTDDARLLAPSAEVLSGRAAIARFWQAGIDAGVEAIELESLEVDLEPAGDLAYEIGRYVLRLQPASGDQVVDRGRYLLVYRREADGHWRRAIETFNPDAPPASEPARTQPAPAPSSMEGFP